MATGFPPNFVSLHAAEEYLRGEALGIIDAKPVLMLHLVAVKHAMDLANALRMHDTQDEDLKVVQMLGMRAFNAFAAAMKLALSGYSQNCALILRDVLENIFLLDFFSSDRARIAEWRFCERRDRLKKFSPVEVRKALDLRDGFTTKKRAETYQMFSELAGHPNMHAVLMLRPEKGGDAVIGPFVEKSTLEATLAEAGRLGVQFGEIVVRFFPAEHAVAERHEFLRVKLQWIRKFYPSAMDTESTSNP